LSESWPSYGDGPGAGGKRAEELSAAPGGGCPLHDFKPIPLKIMYESRRRAVPDFSRGRGESSKEKSVKIGVILFILSRKRKATGKSMAG